MAGVVNYTHSPGEKAEVPEKQRKAGWWQVPAALGGLVAVDHFHYFVLAGLEAKSAKRYDFGRIRTCAPEKTGALIQRLRPLGHEVFRRVHQRAHSATTCEHQWIDQKINP